MAILLICCSYRCSPNNRSTQPGQVIVSPAAPSTLPAEYPPTSYTAANPAAVGPQYPPTSYTAANPAAVGPQYPPTSYTAANPAVVGPQYPPPYQPSGYAAYPPPPPSKEPTPGTVQYPSDAAAGDQAPSYAAAAIISPPNQMTGTIAPSRDPPPPTYSSVIHS